MFVISLKIMQQMIEIDSDRRFQKSIEGLPIDEQIKRSDFRAE